MVPKELEIVGTAHVSKKSIKKVRETILEKKPEVVAVELCRNRYKSLMNQDDEKGIKIKELLNSDRLTLFLVSGFLSYVQGKIGDEIGVKPGTEMLEAINTAKEVNARVVLIDRDIRVTLKRALDRMSFIEKMKFVYELILSFFSKDEAIENVDNMTKGDVLKDAMEYFQNMSPRAYDVLVTERDAYMAKMLLNLNEENVVAVVGAGHEEGIIEYLKNPWKIPPLHDLLDTKKSRFSVGKLILFAIPLVFIGVFALALLHGINIKTSLIEFILLTGGLSSIGAILAGARIYSAITAFLVAPITSIHPLLAAGWFAGLVEAKMRKLSTADLIEFRKCESFRELMHNNLFRVLLVVVGSNIGCSIGTIISIPNVILPLLNKIIGY